MKYYKVIVIASDDRRHATEPKDNFFYYLSSDKSLNEDEIKERVAEDFKKYSHFHIGSFNHITETTEKDFEEGMKTIASQFIL